MSDLPQLKQLESKFDAAGRRQIPRFEAAQHLVHWIYQECALSNYPSYEPVLNKILQSRVADVFDPQSDEGRMLGVLVEESITIRETKHTKTKSMQQFLFSDKLFVPSR